MTKKATKKAVKKASKKSAPTRIFAYKGRVGIESGDDFVNDPSGPGQMGCIVLVKNIEITQEAYDILKKLKKERGSAAPIMCWDSSEGPCFGWAGGYRHIVAEDDTADRDYQPDFLKTQIKKLVVPKEFKEALKA